MLHAYSQSITTVFLWAVPVALVGFVTAWLLKEQPLRGSVTAPDANETFGTNPVERSSLDEIARGLSVLGSREARRDLYIRITRLAGLDIHPATSWLLMRVAKDGRADPVDLARCSTVPAETIERAAVEAETRGLAVREGNPLVLTADGQATVQRLGETCKADLAELLGDWDPARHAELAALLTKLSGELCGGDRVHPEPAARGAPKR